jgi:probable HAF family extracellular repeat protein
MTELGTLGGRSTSALSINNSCQIVGTSDTAKGNVHGFLCDNGKMIDLGTLPNYCLQSAANDINDYGQIVGVSTSTDANRSCHAFLYDHGTMTDLGTLGGDSSGAQSINNLGQIVGNCLENGNSLAFIYENGRMKDLNSMIPANSGWTLFAGTSINDSGQIVGYGYYGTVSSAFLLTPIPEPSTILLFGIGAIGLLAFTWRRRAS